MTTWFAIAFTLEIKLVIQMRCTCFVLLPCPMSMHINSSRLGIPLYICVSDLMRLTHWEFPVN